MRFLRALLLLFLTTLTAAAQNTTTVITLSHLLANGAPVANAKVCASPADSNGTTVSVASVGWGLVLKDHPFCAQVVNGALPSGLSVPDASHTTSAAAIRYNITIQVENANGVATGAPILFNSVPNVSGPTFPLDAYTPTVSTSIPPSGLIYTSGVPSNCTSPSIVIDQTAPAAYMCNNGTLVPLAVATTATHATTADSATNATHATTADSATTATSATSATTASTATALATPPTTCATGLLPSGIDAQGNALNCAVPANATHASSADTAISATNATTANALAATPSDCGSEAMTGINANGTPKSCIAVGSGSAPVGTQYKIAGYTGTGSGSSTQLGQLNCSTDAAGNQLNCPGATTASSIGSYDPTKPLGVSAAYRLAANFIDPATAPNFYPFQSPWVDTQFSDYRTSFDDPVYTHTLNVTATSGASDWLSGSGDNLGNNPNLQALIINQTTQTPYQLGGAIAVNATLHSGNDTAILTANNNGLGKDRGDGETTEIFRIFNWNGEAQPFGGTAAFLGFDANSNPTYQVTPTTGYSNASAGEQRILYDVTKRTAPAGDVTAVNTSYTDAGGAASRFIELTVSADHDLGTSIVTTLTGGADNQQYNGSCPATVVSPATWPANTDPYASPGKVDGTGTKTQHQCVTVGSTAGMAVGDIVGVFGSGVNFEYEKIQSIPDATHLVLNLKRAHSSGELVVDKGGVGFGWQGQVDQAQTGFVWPIVATLDATHILLWTGSDSTYGAKLVSYIYSGTAVPTPLTITPTISGGVVTSIATNTSSFYTTGTAAQVFAQPALTFGGGGCTTNPTFSWSLTTMSASLGYYPTLTSGGSGCAAGLTITAQSVYPNPYYLYPVTRTAFVDNPTMWAALTPTSTAAQRAAVSTSGYIGVDPWADAAMGSTPANGDVIQDAPNFNQAVASQINSTSQPAVARTGIQGPGMVDNLALESDVPLRQVNNTADAAMFVGQQRNGWVPQPSTTTPCPIPNVIGPGTPCYSPLDMQFTPPTGSEIGGIVGTGYLLRLPPVFDRIRSDYGAAVAVDCSTGTSGAHPWNAHPCLEGVKSKYYWFKDRITGDGMLYDQATHNLSLNVNLNLTGTLGAGTSTLGNTTVSSLTDTGSGTFDQGLTVKGAQAFGYGLVFDSTTGVQRNFTFCNPWWNSALYVGTNCINDSTQNVSADGRLALGEVDVSQRATIASLQVGIALPVKLPTPVYSGTPGSSTYSYGFAAKTSSGQLTPLGDPQGVTNAAAILSATNKVTIACYAAAQTGWPAGTTLEVYRIVGGSIYDLGNCAYGSNVVDDGSVVATTTVPSRNATSTLDAGSLAIAGSQYLRGVQGTTGTKAMACTGTFTAGHLVSIDANGNCVDGGAPPTLPPAITTGTATLVAGTVPVSTTAAVVATGGHYQLTNCGTGGTPGILSVGTITAGTSFIINSTSATDTSTVCWWIR